MSADPVSGVLLHWVGGFAAASFYVPYRSVRHWSWEVYWLVGGVFSWILAPSLFAAVRTENLLAVFAAAQPKTLVLCYVFGILWGFGGLSYGLTMRYLGLSLGMAMVLGLTAAFGTLVPPLVSGELLDSMAVTTHGQVVLLGIVIALVGIGIVGLAGQRKEREAGADARQAIAEFDFRKGVAVAVFSGVMSASFAYGLAAGQPIRELTLAQGTDPLAQGLPVLIIVLLGGFTTNFLWCLRLIVKNRTGRQFRGGSLHGEALPLARNYLLCAVAGVTWYMQFFFYTMGESQMGRYGFSSWTLHMASIIIFGTLWGFALKEWAGVERWTRALVWLGIAVLVGATMVIGYGNYLAIGGG